MNNSHPSTLNAPEVHQETSVPTVSKRIWTKAILAGVVGLMVLVGSGYEVYRRQQQNDQSIEYPVTAPTTTPTQESQQHSIRKSAGNFLYLTSFLGSRPRPGTIYYSEGKDVVIEFPDYVTVINEEVNQEGAIIADAQIIIGHNQYFIQNLHGWPLARWDRCSNDGESGGDTSDCTFVFDDGSPIRAMLWVSDKDGIFVLNIQDIRIETYKLNNFSIFKGPIDLDIETVHDMFQGRFTESEIKIWQQLIQGVKTVPARTS